MSQHVEFFHSLIFHLCEDQIVIPFCGTFKNYLHLCICHGACELHARQPHLFVKLHHAVAMAAA